MKTLTVLILAAVLVAVSCRPDKTDLKQLKADAARKRACMKDCTTVKFDPVCAGKQGDKPNL
ncbi:unnamed protein product [Leptidea sinapis]|uniref:Uncharacterized protein n=1 Tax=Leptidea sinapis TaxID=189913 RepID=A0A5E4Q128_9NEOP|nr:unnamed protein product [Leptidea sinapis]